MEILEADPIKQVAMKEKIKKEKATRNQPVLQERCPSRKSLETILEVDEERTSTNEPENKKTYDDA